MYESEANENVGKVCELPQEVLECFSELRKIVVRRTVLPWSEHCTECVWPTCYTSCDQYAPRADQRCQRFVEGMVRVDCPSSLNGYLLKIQFKKWAKLWTEGNLRTYKTAHADRLERKDHQIAKYIGWVPVNWLRVKATHKRYSWKKRMAKIQVRSALLPEAMLIECYNPNNHPVMMTFVIRSEGSPIPYQSLLAMKPGFNRHRIEVSAIGRLVDLSSQFSVELAPNEIEDGCTLYFGAMDFVIDGARQTKEKESVNIIAKDTVQLKLCKCVVWDLDNTLWEGILVEDGAENLRLKPGIMDLLKTLDERGILISAVSKNNRDDALAVLRNFGIAEYFLYPQISWNPKSQGLRQLASDLNIGIDSLMFVDDSPFERAEVNATYPEIMVLDASEYRTILTRAECHAAVTEESKKRRLFYAEQQVRDAAKEEYKGDYLAFLRDCGLHLRVLPMTEANLERVHELTQRTNQMNFSGNRYSKEQLYDIMNNHEIDSYVLDCRDQFGAYGTVGFCTVQRMENRMTDLMFSCRIQAKRVEHAFVSHIIRKYRGLKPCDFFVSYRKTDRNIGPGKVFEELGFEVESEINGVSQLKYPNGKENRDEGIVVIIDETRLTSKPSLAV
jgi:FkbH-like protein